ncbi:MAG: cation:proton antiporter, partial [Nitrospinota bacterium]|nr:cation:proton antiporter [Nitrospinota bacterium]
LADLRKVEPFLRYLTLGQALATGIGLFAIFLLFAWLFHGGQFSELVLGAFLVAAACSVSSPTAISMTAARLPKTALSKVRPLLVVATLDLAPALVVVGLVFCFFDGTQGSAFSPERGLALLIHSFIIAALLAVMFLLIDRKRLSEEHNLVVFLGFIIFASGISFYLGLSPLFTNLVVGVVLANTLSHDDTLHSALHSTEKPFYVILLVLAGMWWTAVGPMVWITALALVAGRIALKLYSMRVLERMVDGGRQLAPEAGLALCSPGAMGLAMGLNFLLGYHGQVAAFAFGVIAVSTMFSEAVAPALIRRAVGMAEGQKKTEEKADVAE